MSKSYKNSQLYKAFYFAYKAHGNQKRKYTGDPYMMHPLAVAQIVKDYGGTEEMQMAAFLHDVVEDTHIAIVDIEQNFGLKVANLVGWLTDISRPTDGNRSVRKAIDRKHSADSPAEAQFIKLADLLDNTKSIVEHDPKFAKVYLKEKELLLDAMDKVHDTELFSVVSQQIS
tara:strand:- start:2879 stop:3394 length:516 start_codon:yes stop_codon:yes gene_type:complete